MPLLRRIRPRSGLNLFAILLGFVFIDCTGTLSGSRPIPADPCFEGEFVQRYVDGSAVWLLVAHDGGAVTATGWHSRTGIPWESLEFSGSVSSREGEAQGLLTLHFPYDAVSGTFPEREADDRVSLFLRGTGDCAARTPLEFSFFYNDLEGLRRSESYSLTRIP